VVGAAETSVARAVATVTAAGPEVAAPVRVPAAVTAVPGARTAVVVPDRARATAAAADPAPTGAVDPAPTGAVDPAVSADLARQGRSTTVSVGAAAGWRRSPLAFPTPASPRA
jgi:hypothetical protein